MISKPLFRIIALCSFIIGAILGVFPLIPALIGISFFLLMFGVAPFMLIYLRKLNILKSIEIEESLVIGSISGAVALLGFATIYFPIAFILQLIFKIQSFIWIKVLFVNIGFLIPMVILIALTSALLNAFSGFLTAYFYQSFQAKK
ncbi:MAG: hypothetical protein IJY61_06875 [Candidatus Gastranaerophilales bacterium]|nr:hypothetical protein [Candidatus Gastranaerophilales bacterium]